MWRNGLSVMTVAGCAVNVAAQLSLNRRMRIKLVSCQMAPSMMDEGAGGAGGHRGKAGVKSMANVELRALSQFKSQRFTGVREVVFKRAGGGFP